MIKLKCLIVEVFTVSRPNLKTAIEFIEKILPLVSGEEEEGEGKEGGGGGGARTN